MPDQKRKEFQKLVDKYLNGTATSEEQEALDRYYLLFRDEPENTSMLNKDQLIGLEKRMESGLFSRIQETVRVKPLWPRIAAAASVLLILTAGGYFLLHKQTAQQTALIQKQDIAPGSNKATLTIANGQTIVLNGAHNGRLTVQGTMAVTKTSDGEVVYKNNSAQVPPAPAGLIYNTMTTPRAGKYDLTLADGTKVWLDAASSITYPVAFTGNDRSVKITGQAYFEVAHNAAKPFRVSVNGETVEVLGTHFNINAYNDEPVLKTTLLEGSVKITHNGQVAILKPGQQAQVKNSETDPKIGVISTDTEEATAWKSGYFFFDHESLESVMRKVSRWYDVDISYPTDQKITENYLGSITRYDKVSKVLAMLEITGHVHFKVEGKQIIITKK